MGRKKIHETLVGRCAIRIYRDSDFDEYVVRTLMPTPGNSKIPPTPPARNFFKAEDYFTSDKGDARSTAAREVKRLRKDWWRCGSGNPNRSLQQLQRDFVRLDHDIERGVISPDVGARAAQELQTLISRVRR